MLPSSIVIPRAAQSLPDSFRQYFVPVFCYPYYVMLDIVYAMTRMQVFRHVITSGLILSQPSRLFNR
jgi:hypothetical protein